MDILEKKDVNKKFKNLCLVRAKYSVCLSVYW